MSRGTPLTIFQGSSNAANPTSGKANAAIMDDDVQIVEPPEAEVSPHIIP